MPLDAHASVVANPYSRDLVSQKLARRPGRRSEARGRAASVLIALFEHEHTTRVVFIKRTESMRSHKGQYAFPGGRRDATDPTFEFTALREAHEEIGLEPSCVVVLGNLDDLVTSSGYVVTPVVGWIPAGCSFTPNPDEVQFVVDLPLDAFVTPPRARTLLREGIRRIALAFDVDGHFIWGATASILRAFVATLTS